MEVKLVYKNNLLYKKIYSNEKNIYHITEYFKNGNVKTEIGLNYLFLNAVDDIGFLRALSMAHLFPWQIGIDLFKIVSYHENGKINTIGSVDFTEFKKIIQSENLENNKNELSDVKYLGYFYEFNEKGDYVKSIYYNY